MAKKKNMNRCHWCNPNNPLYVEYHDKEWGVLNLDEDYLFEMLLLESFQAGLSWECILNKREDFCRAFSIFDPKSIADFNEEKINELLLNPNIVRNKLKIKAAINNAKIFLEIEKEYSSFRDYLYTFWNKEIIIENDKTTNSLSDTISKDLKKRGMKFVGSTIVYSFLQAVGIINSHEEDCFLYGGKEKMKEIDYKDLKFNPTEIFSEGWPEIVTGKVGDKINAMTISWGEIGSIWGHGCGMPVVTVFVRPQRFSKILLDKEECFTLCFFDKKYKKELAYLGSHSGRDEDKITKVGFTSTSFDEYSYIDQADMVFICRKLYQQTMKEECFVDKSLISDHYPKKDFHDLYIAKIEKVLIKE